MIYSFQCNTKKCSNYHKIEDRLIRMDDVDKQTCKDCGKLMDQVDTFCTSFILKGKFH